MQLKSDNANMQLAATYFRELFQNPAANKKSEGNNWRLSDFDHTEMLEEICDVEFIEQAIKYSPNYKAPGESNITNEMLKVIGRNIAPVLANWFRYCLISGTTPAGWKNAIIVPVHKKGKRDDISNYRPISLLENVRKLYERCIERYMKQKISPLEMQQGGFRAGRSTLDQALSLNEFIKVYKAEYKMYPVIAYLDIKSAYDSVDRNLLYSECKKKGVPDILVESIRQLFEFNKAKVKINHKFSSSFHMPAGVQQGSILSPLLYSIYIDPIITELRKGPGLKIQNQLKANCLLYADDIALIAKNDTEMNSLLNIAHGMEKKLHFKFNIDKCAYTSGNESNIRLGANRIKRVDKFFYLGICFDYKGMNAKCHIQDKGKKVMKLIQLFKYIGMNAKGYSLSSNILIYNTFIRSVFEYALPIMELTKESIKMLNKLQYQALCDMVSVNTKSSYAFLKTITGNVDMRNRVEILQFKWLRRFDNMANDPTMLLPIVEEWCASNEVESALKRIVVSCSIYTNDIVNTNEIIPEYISRVLENDRLICKNLSVTALSDIDGILIRKFFGNRIIQQQDIQSIILFLLNKMPGKPVNCKRCSKKVTKEHMVVCNADEWLHLVSKYNSNQETRNIMLSTNEFYERPTALPFQILRLAILVKTNEVKKTIVEDLSKTIKDSFKKCVCFENNSNLY